MEVSSIMVQQMYQSVQTTTNMIKQTAKNDAAVLQLVEQAIQMTPDTTSGRGQNLNMVL